MGPKVEESKMSKIMEYLKKLEVQRVKDKEELEKLEKARENSRREELVRLDKARREDLEKLDKARREDKGEMLTEIKSIIGEFKETIEKELGAQAAQIGECITEMREVKEDVEQVRTVPLFSLPRY